jgi:hypothetical protein
MKRKELLELTKQFENEFKKHPTKITERINAINELVYLAWLIIYDTKIPESEKLEKIGNAINIYYEKYDPAE